MQYYSKLYSRRFPDVFIKVIPGHFVTPNSHINYYIDMTTMRSRLTEAKNAAEALSEVYVATTVVDTIICLDGTEVIGAFLGEALTKAGVLSKNAHRTMYIMTPEFDTSGQMIFRENVQMMIRGNVSGVSAIFSAASKVCGCPVNALFTKQDIPEYRTWKADECSLCKEGIPVDAIANGYGYSRL